MVRGTAMFIVGILIIFWAAAGMVATLLAPGPPAWWLLLLNMAAIWLGAGFVRRSLHARSRARAEDGGEQGPVAIPDRDLLAQVKDAVHACPRCGYPGMKPPTLSDGIWPGGGETNFLVCGRCAFRGQAIIFDDGAAYGAFLESLHDAESSAEAAVVPAQS